MARHMSRLLGLALVLTMMMSALAGPAAAAPTPPAADSRLLGTWVNTDPATRSIKQIVVRGLSNGGLIVDAFGACGGGLCEWGRVSATVYGPNVSAKTGTHFRTNQRFLAGNSEFSRTVLFGNVRSTRSGRRLTVRKLTVFTDGSGRRNYTGTDRFAPGRGAAPSKNGHAVGTYPQGLPPAPVAGLFGSWKNTSSTPAIAGLDIAKSGGTPIVQGWGACTPSPCDMGKVRGITYGKSISASRGRTVLAPFSFGFKNEQLIITYKRKADGSEILTVANYNEFTDGSGRSNYMVTERFVRA
ncbi:MAG: hypothetical protein GEU74_06130 [Nitriliruptorales bacterium]|nr:hypothetical protein [Nitriliruptorales bacterium]